MGVEGKWPVMIGPGLYNEEDRELLEFHDLHVRNLDTLLSRDQTRARQNGQQCGLSLSPRSRCTAKQRRVSIMTEASSHFNIDFQIVFAPSSFNQIYEPSPPAIRSSKP